MNSPQARTVELLQQLGLKEYEAESFVALTRLSQGTAKEVSENSAVPRTRVYDAVRVLESMGLIEIQYSNPKQFRAVSIDEAVETLRGEYEDRIDALREALGALEPVGGDTKSDERYEVWSLSGGEAIANRAQKVVAEADDEVLFLVGAEGAFDGTLAARLEAAQARGVTVVVGTGSEASRDRIQTALPDAAVFVTDQAWLQSPVRTGDDTEISRVMLVDRETILVSTVRRDDGRRLEHAAFGKGFDNGFVAIVRRLMVSGLRQDDGPGTGEP